MLKRVVKKFLNNINIIGLRLDQDERELLNKYPKATFRQVSYAKAMTYPKKVGEISMNESRFLMELVQSARLAGPIIEIGSLFGSSTKIILISKKPEQIVISVDNYSWNPFDFPSELHQDLTAQLLEGQKFIKDLQLINSDKNSFYKTYSGAKPSLVFLDAIHSYSETKTDIEWAIATGAEIIAGHDYDEKNFPGVVKAVQEFGGPKRIVETLWQL